jgi:hypothetical protein
LMILEYAMKASCSPRATCWYFGVHDSVHLITKKMIIGSKATESEVNVARCRA